MRRMIGRQALFFAGIVVICLLLVPFTPSELSWIVWATAGLAGLWTILFAIEDLLRPTRTPKSRSASETAQVAPESPFGPPPRPGR
jgi:uncharacterized membrane protein YuzA (DUF378 family)